MKQVFKPGKYIVVDEYMSFWKGIESSYQHDSFINITYIPRKPVNLGEEIQVQLRWRICDNDTLGNTKREERYQAGV